jgi:hypothetical protein
MPSKFHTPFNGRFLCTRRNTWEKNIPPFNSILHLMFYIYAILNKEMFLNYEYVIDNNYPRVKQTIKNMRLL